MKTDSATGMKFVVFLIIASIMFFIAGLFVGWVRDSWITPPGDEQSYPAPRTY